MLGRNGYTGACLATLVTGSDRREMTPDEARVFVLEVLSDGAKHTTAAIDAASAARGKRCPDATVRFLAKLRLQGIVEGELSAPHRTWLWWLPEFPDAPEPPVDV